MSAKVKNVFVDIQLYVYAIVMNIIKSIKQSDSEIAKGIVGVLQAGHYYREKLPKKLPT